MAACNWDGVVASLTKNLKQHLKNIKNEDLVEYCLKQDQIRNVAEKYLQNCLQYKKSRPKNSAVAAKKKEEGNEMYSKMQFRESLVLYSGSIFYADKNCEVLPLAYSNRSLLLQHLGFIEECLQDIEMALSTGYPKSKVGKLLARKEKCLAYLKEDQGSNPRAKIKEFVIPEPSGGENENFVSASKSISVCYSRSKGRHVVANRDIDMGEVLFVEKPFAFVLFKEACYNCCKGLIAPIPCWYCLDVSYCSPKCRDESWETIHSFECGFHWIFNSIGIAHLSLRIILSGSSSFDELKKTLSEVKEPEYEEGEVVFNSKKYDSVYNLVTNVEKYKKNDMFQYVMTAVLLAIYLKNHTKYFSKTPEHEDLKLLVRTITRHILQLICNGHAIVDVFTQDSRSLMAKETEERIGTAIYPSASMMNHSCEPSIVNSFHNNCLIVRASKPIKRGEEVFNCYGPHARRMKRKERQEILSKQYFFKCSCTACCERIDIYEIFTALKCEICKGPAVHEENRPNVVVCRNCSKTWPVSREIKEKQALISSLIKEGQSDVSLDPHSALKKLLKCWFIGREIYFKFHRDLGFVADEISSCLVILEDYRRSIMFLKCSILSVEKRFGSSSIELANERKKIGDVITSCANETDISTMRDLALQGLEYYQKAATVIELLYGKYHPDLAEIEEHKEILQLALNN